MQLNFKEWLTEDQWKALRVAIEAGHKAYTSCIEKEKIKNKPKVKKPKEKPKQKREENLHKWLLEQKKIPR